MKPVWAAMAGVAVMAAFTGAFSSCQGQLSNADSYPVPCDPLSIFHGYCAGSKCHDPAPDADPGQLDLFTGTIDDIAARLRDKQASYYGVPDNERVTCPSKALLIDTGNPGASWIIKKLEGGQGTCGAKMPYSGPTLHTPDVQCLENWALTVAGAKPEAGAGGSTP